jgi:hypothetical protein
MGMEKGGERGVPPRFELTRHEFNFRVHQNPTCDQLADRGLPMTDDLDILVKPALTKATSSGELEDLNKAAEIAKAIAETSKAKADIANAGAQMRLEGLKSLATFLVPIVSFLTITFTVYIQFLQLKEAQRQNEATQWRDFLTSAKTSANSIQSDPTFSPRLRSFFDSPAYRNQAISISKRMMGGLANFAGFKDLFGVTFTEVDPTTLVDVLDVGRSLYVNLNTTYSDCATFTENLEDGIKEKIPTVEAAAGICSTLISEKNLRGLGLSSQELQKLSELRQNVSAFELENSFLSEKIAEFLRAYYAVGSPFAPDSISLSKLYIAYADLSNVDFSNFDISDTVIDSCTLKGAKLTPKKYGGAMDIRSSAWWDAVEVNQGALDGLIASYFPYYHEQEIFPNNESVDQAYYASRLQVLCLPMRSNCEAAQLKFGKKASPPSDNTNK